MESEQIKMGLVIVLDCGGGGGGGGSCSSSSSSNSISCEYLKYS